MKKIKVTHNDKFLEWIYPENTQSQVFWYKVRMFIGDVLSFILGFAIFFAILWVVLFITQGL